MSAAISVALWDEMSRAEAARQAKKREMLLTLYEGDWEEHWFKAVGSEYKLMKLTPKYKILGPRERYSGTFPPPPPAANTYAVSDLDVEDPVTFQKLCEEAMDTEAIIRAMVDGSSCPKRYAELTARLPQIHYAIREALRMSRFASPA